MSCKLFVLCALAALASNAVALDTEAIIGRMSEARPVNYFVTIKRDGKPVCRGGIIGTWVILTAASCVFDKSTNDFIPGSMSIIAGHGNATVAVDVEKIYVPKEFTEQEIDTVVIGDIAVLKLKENLNIKENHKTLQRLTTPRKLRGKGFKDYLNEKTKIATFDQDHINITLPYLLNAKVIDNEKCTARSGLPVQTTELCANIEDSSYAPMKLCKIDIGSPLVFNNRVVVGVTLISSNHCILNGEPAVYTRVSSYLPFIQAARYGKDEDVVVKVL